MKVVTTLGCELAQIGLTSGLKAVLSELNADALGLSPYGKP